MEVLKQKEVSESVVLLIDYTLQMLQWEMLLSDPQETLITACDWATIGFEKITGHRPMPSDSGSIIQASVAAVHSFLQQQADGLGLLYTFGYTMPFAELLIEQLIALKVVIFDTRSSANSRAAKWRKAQLQERFGGQYLHIQAFGNVNYN